MGQFDPANTHLQESLTIFEKQEAPYELGLALMALALLRQAEAEISLPKDEQLHMQAIEACEQAMARFEELGAEFDLEVAQQIRDSL